MKSLFISTGLVALLACGAANAAFEPMDNQQLQAVQGQGASAATINWELALNQTAPGVFDAAGCAQLEFCRIGISLNNRFSDKSYIDRNGQARNAAGTNIPNITGKKEWLVFKGVQGSIRILGVDIDGADLVYKNKSNADEIKAALQLTFNAAKPIEIRNLGFSAISIETDSVANEGTGNVAGYLSMDSGGTGAGAYANGKYTDVTNKFDLGRETGFTGLNINGNLAVQGTLKIFSCDGSMPRC